MNIEKNILKKIKENTLEVEDVLDSARTGNSSTAKFIMDLAGKHSWEDFEETGGRRRVPLRTWSKVVALYMEKNHYGLSSLVRDKDGKYLDTAKFVASVLEHVHTRESFLMLLSNFSEIFENPCGNSELCKKLVESINLLLSFPPKINVEISEAEVVRGFLHKLLESANDNNELGNIYCALRAVGNQQSIVLMQNRPLLSNEWAGIESQVIKMIKINPLNQ